MSDGPPAPHSRVPAVAGGEGSDAAWSIVSTLISGPLVWGLVGAGADRWLGTSVLLPVGLVLGFVLAFYVVHVRFFRDPAHLPEQLHDTRTGPPRGPAEQEDDH